MANGSKPIWQGLLVGLASCLLLAGCASTSGTSPRASDGRLDLSGWDFERDGDVALVGSWEICWNQHVAPGEPCPSGWRSVPVRGLWNESSVESPFGGKGVATYRLRVSLPARPAALSIAVGGPLTAHRLWIDGEERGGLGVVGRTAETTSSEVFNRVYDIPHPSSEIAIQVQVANFEFRGGGLRRIWYLGRADSIQQGVGHAVLREGLLFAAGVVVGLSFLVLFALRPSEQARGYFGMMALVLGLRAVPASISNFGELMAPWMSWGFTVRAEYLGMALAYFAAVGYVHTKVPGLTPPRTMRGLQLFALAFAAVVAFAPMPLVLATLPIQWALPPILIAIVCLCYGRAWSRGVQEAGLTAATAVAYAGFVFHDIVRSMQSGAGARIELFPYAVAMWILVEAYQLLKNLHRSLERVESLSEELSESNFELQETEASIVRFVPFDFLRALGKESLHDVRSGDHARTRMAVVHCGFHGRMRAEVPAGDEASPTSDFVQINALVGRLEPAVTDRGGFLSDYRADGFQAFFPGGARDALNAAREMFDRIERKEGETSAPPTATIDMRIGIDVGTIELGTAGSGDQLFRGLTGEPIEGARRTETEAARRQARILVSAAVCEELSNDGGAEVALRAIDSPRGDESQHRPNASGVFEVLG